MFRDDFDAVKMNETGARGWHFLTGDGTATMSLRQGGKGWASIQRSTPPTSRRGSGGRWSSATSPGLDVGQLRAGHEVTIEARVRTSPPPAG